MCERVTVSAETYRQIIEACFPQLQIDSVTLLSEGWDSVAVEVNRALIFRFPKRPDVELQYPKERLLLPALAQALSIAVPRFEFVWDGGAPYDHLFVGYPMIEGRQLTGELLSSLQVGRVAEQLALFLSELHRFPPEQAARLMVCDGDLMPWRQRFLDLYRRIQAQVFPLLDDRTRSAVAARWAAFLNDEAHFQFRPALVHADLNGEHILVDSERSAIIGVIDWGDASIGDPAIDFTGLLADYGRDFVEQVLAHYEGEVDATLGRRAQFYVGVMPFHTILFGLETESQAHVGRGLAALGAAG